jgi:hypothetical protein
LSLPGIEPRVSWRPARDQSPYLLLILQVKAEGTGTCIEGKSKPMPWVICNYSLTDIWISTIEFSSGATWVLKQCHNTTDRRIWWILTMVCNTQIYWVSGLVPSSWILNTRKHNVSETGSISFFRWVEGDTYSVWLALSRESSE